MDRDSKKQEFEEYVGRKLWSYGLFLGVLLLLVLIGQGVLVRRSAQPRFVAYKAIEAQLNVDGVPDWLKTDHDREVFRLGQNDVMRRLALLEVNP